MPISIARLYEMAGQLREAGRGDQDIRDALSDIRDADLEQLLVQGGVALNHAKVLGYMLSHEAWCLENAAGERRDSLQFSAQTWCNLSDQIRDAAQFSASLARSRGDLPLPMKVYILVVIRTWKLVVALTDEVQQLGGSVKAA